MILDDPHLFLTRRFVVEMSVTETANDRWLAQRLLDYLCADEINGLPQVILSVNGVEPFDDVASSRERLSGG